MSLPEKDKLLDALRRGKLTADLARQLERCGADDPEFRSLCQDEAALNQLLCGLPEAPLSSNFTTQVLQAARRDAAARESDRMGWPRWPFRRWVPKLAVLGLAVSLGVISYQQHQAATRRELARSLAEISQLPDAPIDLLQNFEAIERLNQVPAHVDRELIAALQ